MKILIVLTSHDQLGNTGRKTGFWLEEFASPYYALKDAGAAITLASPKGGQPPIDPGSNAPDMQTPATERFRSDTEAQAALADTAKLSDMDANKFDAVMYPGGHGPLWDLATDKNSIALIEAMAAADKPVATVCHASAVLINANSADNEPFVKGRNVTGFSNSEEAAVQLTDIVPFLLEDDLQAKGANWSKGDDWQSHVVTDGKLVTGQNPASSEAVAKALLQLL